MNFQTRLLLTYLLLIVVLVVMLGTSFYIYSTGIIERNAYSNLKVIAEKMSQQFDAHVKPMDLLTVYLLSDGNILRSVTMLANIDRDDPNNERYITEAKAIIQSGLLTYAIDKYFYRVSFINENGDFLTSNFRERVRTRDIDSIIESLNWREKAKDKEGGIAIIPPYLDPWSMFDGKNVFSLVRMIRTIGERTYLEVQSPFEELERIFSIPEEEMVNVTAFNHDGSLLYTNIDLDDELLSYYRQFSTKNTKTFIDMHNPITEKREIIVRVDSDYTNVSIILAQDKESLFRPFLYTSYLIVTIGLIILFTSFAYIYFFSKRLVKPITELKEKIEATKLDNLPDALDLKSSNNEIEALNTSFQKLKERLNEAVNREIKAQSLQIQASFDSLQAQVNPHFLYNILNVLANKGVENKDEEICEICDGIASMLRYSTSTLERSATIREEVDHLSKYLSLMKKRFEHRLEYSVEVDENILDEKIPKIVLQQIAENSIEHGYRNLKKKMELQIRGYILDEKWVIEVKDNGEGFNEKAIFDLEENMVTIEKEIMNNTFQRGFAIGGMGIINIYGRLKLYLKEDFFFTFGNNSNGGAFVKLGGKRHMYRGKSIDV